MQMRHLRVEQGLFQDLKELTDVAFGAAYVPAETDASLRETMINNS